MSKATEQSAQSEAVAALGERIVADLGLDESVDTLSRWMAHYIAELLQEAAAATGDSRQTKQAQLHDAILTLWARRFELPAGKRPFRDFEPILRALASLDPNPAPSRYLSPSRQPASESGESEEARRWIALANTLDHTSKLLIDYCLASAADAALDKCAEWVELARKAGAADSFEFFVVDFIKDERDLMKEVGSSSHQRQVLEDRHAKLEELLSSARTLMADIKNRLASLPPEAAASETGQPEAGQS